MMTSEKSLKRLERDRAKRATRENLQKAFGYGLPAIVVSAVLGFILSVYLGSGVVSIDYANEQQVRDVFFSGEPWVVGCQEGRAAKTPKVLTDAAWSLWLEHINVGVINCQGKLPSGKSVAERFKVTPISGQAKIMLAANGKKTMQIMPTYMKTPGALVKFAVSASKVRYLTPAGDHQFQEDCIRRKHCIMYIHKAPLEPHDKTLFSEAATRHRKIPFAQLNLFKGTPQFGIAQLSAAKLKEMQHPIVVAYEEVDGKPTVRIHDGPFPNPATVTRLIHSSDVIPLKKRPYFLPRPAAKTKPKTKSKSSSPSPSASPSSPSASSDERAHEGARPSDDEQLKRERQRRRDMDKQNLIEDLEDEELEFDQEEEELLLEDEDEEEIEV